MNGKRRKQIREQLYGKRHGKCALCGDHVFWEDSTIDHIVPVSKGGADARHNMQMTHRECNERKADSH